MATPETDENALGAHASRVLAAPTGAVQRFLRSCQHAGRVRSQDLLRRNHHPMFRSISYLLMILATFASYAVAQTTPPSTAPAASEQQAAKQNSLVNTPPPAELSKEQIPAGSKVYIAPLEGYESFLVAAMIKKETPIVVVNSREKAEYEISGVSESVKAGWAKMLFLGSQQSNEQASIVMTNLKSGVAVWGYNVHKSNSYKGKQSSSEACAKHLKARIEGKE
jgi:hypothetical protein